MVLRDMYQERAAWV